MPPGRWNRSLSLLQQLLGDHFRGHGHAGGPPRAVEFLLQLLREFKVASLLLDHCFAALLIADDQFLETVRLFVETSSCNAWRRILLFSIRFRHRFRRTTFRLGHLGRSGREFELSFAATCRRGGRF